MKRTSFLVLVLEGLVGLHSTFQLQLLWHYRLGHRLGLPWYWMVCLGNEQRSFCRFWDLHPRGLWKLPDGRGWLRGKLGLVLMGRDGLSKSLIQFSVHGQGNIPSLLLDLRPNYGGGNEDNVDLLQKVPCMHCHTQCPWPCSRLPSTHASARDSRTLTGKSGSISCGVTAPFSWVLVHRSSVCAPQESVSPVLCKFWWLCGGVNGDLLQEGLCHTQVCSTQTFTLMTAKVSC